MTLQEAKQKVLELWHADDESRPCIQVLYGGKCWSSVINRFEEKPSQECLNFLFPSHSPEEPDWDVRLIGAQECEQILHPLIQYLEQLSQDQEESTEKQQ